MYITYRCDKNPQTGVINRTLAGTFTSREVAQELAETLNKAHRSETVVYAAVMDVDAKQLHIKL